MKNRQIEVENQILNRRVISIIRELGIAIAVLSLSLVTGCNAPSVTPGVVTLNSRYHDQDSALSGDGKLVAFVSNRDGKNRIYIYSLERKTLINLPGLDIGDSIVESPSLSYTGRYVTYISSIQGRPDLILYDRATGKSELLTRGYRSWLRNPHISPDGRYVVFETSRRGQWDLEVLDRGPFIELDLPDGLPISQP